MLEMLSYLTHFHVLWYTFAMRTDARAKKVDYCTSLPAELLIAVSSVC